MDNPRNAQADAIIDTLAQQDIGRLTVFLGAAPGVGKTYAMLNRARELQRQGKDIVIGLVETHGRSETQALVDGLPIVPRQQLAHHGRTLEEMDLDGLLKRHPDVVLVDELAHRNAPGARHERRWQDVEELLDAGIEVYTTMNIQHLESLNDVVFQITGVRVSETVPDALFERLRDVRLVDLPVRELIERLNQGKVYLPEQATQALHAYFTPTNLTALRELAMQTVADHVDADWRLTRAAWGLSGIALQRHVMIAIDGCGQSEYLVRAGCRIAERRGVPWSVVTVHNDRTAKALTNTSVKEQARQLERDKAFALARNLGGETEVLHGSDTADALLVAAEARGASTIVIGRTRERPIARMFNQTLTQQLLQRGEQYELTIVNTPVLPKSSRHRPWFDYDKLTWRDAGMTVGATVTATAIAALSEKMLGLNDLSMVFMLAVLIVASRTRMATAFIAALLCFFSYNFFFIAPAYTLTIGTHKGVATVLTFFAAALVAGKLASRLHMQVLALRAANSHAIAMQSLGRRLSKAVDLGQVMRSGRDSLHAGLNADVWMQINGETSAPHTAPSLSEKDLVAAAWTHKNGQASGRYTDTLASSPWWFLPVQSDRETLGVVGLRFSNGMPRLTFEQRRLAEAMIEDISQAVLRARLVHDLEIARMNGETERLRSALLSSVSHDLRSPLASIIGSADSLASYRHAMSEQDQQSLLETIHVEGERLDRYIQNLLDMTRLGQQGLTLVRDWIGIDDLIVSATTRLKHYLPHVCYDIALPPDLPPIHVHPALVEQALFNVMENAAKFSPAGQAIRIAVRQTPDGQLQVDITDKGPGIPEEERVRIFDMFYSVERGDRGKNGTGLGLTIVQGIIGAHMGKVEALPGSDGQGTMIRLTLPWGESPISQETSDANDD